MDFEKIYKISCNLDNNLTIDDYDISLKAKEELKRLIPIYISRAERIFEEAMKEEKNGEFIQTLRSKTKEELDEFLEDFISRNLFGELYKYFECYLPCEKEDMRHLPDIFYTQITKVAKKELYKIFEDRTNYNKIIEDIITLLEYFGIFVYDFSIEPEDKEHTYCYCLANKTASEEEELLNKVICSNTKIIDKEELLDGLTICCDGISFCLNVYHEDFCGLYDKILYMFMGYSKFSPIDLKHDKLSKIFKEECEITKYAKKEGDI